MYFLNGVRNADPSDPCDDGVRVQRTRPRRRDHHSEQTSRCDITRYSATSVFILVMRMQSKIFSLGLDAELDACEKEMEPWEAQLQAAPPIVVFSDRPNDHKAAREDARAGNGSE
jgi:hypothetical protein